MYTEYVTHRRALPELAAEKGMSTANMARWAARHRITLRGRGSASRARRLRADSDCQNAADVL